MFFLDYFGNLLLYHYYYLQALVYPIIVIQ